MVSGPPQAHARSHPYRPNGVAAEDLPAAANTGAAGTEAAATGAVDTEAAGAEITSCCGAVTRLPILMKASVFLCRSGASNVRVQITVSMLRR